VGHQAVKPRLERDGSDRMQDFKDLTQLFIRKLFLTIQGSINAYLSVTQNLPEEHRESAWKEYNEAFEEHVLGDILELMEKNKCGVAELCHAVLKLMDVAATSVEKIEETEGNETDENEAIKAWFVPWQH
jgi:hypothetical protein